MCSYFSKQLVGLTDGILTCLCDDDIVGLEELREPWPEPFMVDDIMVLLRDFAKEFRHWNLAPDGMEFLQEPSQFGQKMLHPDVIKAGVFDFGVVGVKLLKVD